MMSLKTGQPLVSVIMPTYNHAKFIGKAIGSVLNQTYKNFELIIIDNYSGDETEKIVASYKDDRIIYLKFSNNGVIAASRNHGIKRSHGEYIAFLDSDDWWYPNKLLVASKYLNRADIFFHNLHIFRQNRKSFAKFKGRKLNSPVFVDLMTKGNALATSSVIVKKEILNSVNLFSEDKKLIAVEDFDTWLKISMKTQKFFYISKTLGAYWQHDSNTSTASFEQYNRNRLVYEKYLSFLSPQDKLYTEAVISYALGHIKLRHGLYTDAKELFKLALKTRNIKFKLKSLFMVNFLTILSKYNKIKIKLCKSIVTIK